MRRFRSYDRESRERQRKKRKALLAMMIVFLAGMAGVLGVILWKTFTPAAVPLAAASLSSYADSEKNTDEVQDVTWEVTEADEGNALVDAGGDPVLEEANRLAMQYDYDKAIELVQSSAEFETNELYQKAAASYADLKSQCVVWDRYDQITHIFFHSLVVDSELAFSSYKSEDYNEVMTTMDEFKAIIQSMYDKGYVLISLHKIAKEEVQEDGTVQMVKQEILLPKGKKPFVLSEDDVCYYEYMTGTGFATKLCLDENGKVVNEYVDRDGNVLYGSYDVLTVLEDFIEEHPDFSYQGSKGILAFTGYDGILGYRTSDFWYAEDCPYYISNETNDWQKANEHTSPNPNLEQDKQTASEVAAAIKALGWELASHSWGHLNMKTASYDRVAWDTAMWEMEVAPLIGDTDIILYPLGADVGEWQITQYSDENEKYVVLRDAGFRYFCNVDSAQYWVQIGSDFMRQGRRNMDGQMMFKQLVYPDKMLTSDLFDVEEVFDRARFLPVSGVTLPDGFDLDALAETLGMSVKEE